MLHVTLLLGHAPRQNFTTEAPLYLKGQTRFVGIKTADLIRVSRVKFQKELEENFLSCQSTIFNKFVLMYISCIKNDPDDMLK